MGRTAAWVQEQTGRPPLYSPGRPTQWRREHMVVFWQAIAEGVTSEEAAARAGFSQAAGSRMFREGGGINQTAELPAGLFNPDESFWHH